MLKQLLPHRIALLAVKIKAEVNDRLAKARAWRAAMNLDP